MTTSPSHSVPASRPVRHFLRDDDLSPEELLTVLDLADRLKAERAVGQLTARPLDGPRAVAVLFDKHSTRTRVSFSVGIAELGGYPLVIDAQTSQLGRAGTGRRHHAGPGPVVRRDRVADLRPGPSRSHGRAQSGSGGQRVDRQFHPCQILADLQTIRERLHALSGVTLCYLGDGSNNMAHSYLLGGANAGMHVRIATRGGGPRPPVVDDARRLAARTGGSVWVGHDPVAAAPPAPTSWPPTPGCRWDRTAPRRRPPSSARSPWTSLSGPRLVNSCRAALSPGLPGLEISAEVIDGPASAVWDEAENRLHAQKALLSWLLEQP